MGLFDNTLERRGPVRARGYVFVLVTLLSACLRSPGSSPVTREDDKSIVFPQFFEHEAVRVSADAAIYELNGELLQAMMIATNDFLRADDKNQGCWERQGTRYRVIRQGEVIFVYVYRDLAACGLSYAAADLGAKYAISADGRILRRVVDGEPLEPMMSKGLDGGRQAVPAELGTSAEFDAGWSLDGGGAGGPVR
jgi:hypothetical protein